MTDHMLYDRSGPGMWRGRRAHPRVPVLRPAQVLDPTDLSHEALIVDFSRAGLLIALDGQLGQGDTVQVTVFQNPRETQSDGEPIVFGGDEPDSDAYFTVQGEIVWRSTRLRRDLRHEKKLQGKSFYGVRCRPFERLLERTSPEPPPVTKGEVLIGDEAAAALLEHMIRNYRERDSRKASQDPWDLLRPIRRSRPENVGIGSGPGAGAVSTGLGAAHLPEDEFSSADDRPPWESWEAWPSRAVRWTNERAERLTTLLTSKESAEWRSRWVYRRVGILVALLVLCLLLFNIYWQRFGESVTDPPKTSEGLIDLESGILSGRPQDSGIATDDPAANSRMSPSSDEIDPLLLNGLAEPTLSVNRSELIGTPRSDPAAWAERPSGGLPLPGEGAPSPEFAPGELRMTLPAAGPTPSSQENSSDLLGTEKSRAEIAEALSRIATGGDTSVDVADGSRGEDEEPLSDSPPPFENGILVDKSKMQLQLWRDGRLEATYRVGIGSDGLTPAAEFATAEFVEKPAWKDPSGGFVAGGAEDNPLGAVWIGLSPNDPTVGSGFGIHGTNDPGSIGSEQSRGCIRMRNEDAIELYSRVKPGMKVIILE